MWGSVADMLMSAKNIDFYPDSFFASLVFVVLAESIFFLLLFYKIRRRKKINLNMGESESVFLYVIGAFTGTTWTTIPAMICMYIDVKTDILPFAREIGQTPVEFFVGISAFNMMIVSAVVLLSRHYTLRS